MERHYFIAIPVRSSELERLAEGAKLERCYKNVYDRTEYHLTLRFLGALTEEEVITWQRALKALARVTQPFTIKMDRVLTFGVAERPRVFTVGVEDSAVLSRLVDQIEPDRHQSFVPHITLAKRWDATYKGPVPDLSLNLPLDVNEFILYEIDPYARPRYRVHTLVTCEKEQ
ncbi:RNA 2',3'-cyclic phosphodiesterase [Exiguobacterium sp. s193]|uniref:RNA 2',3'-cyclic phosphodiesterase n=1 Tax=Exiguobacterium sp. s193 TaxID=2751207 RepID=UPI001BE5CD0B|nr:RNA 2',3'-cyclic phosphodiesterase [Exiguobacterium sp. s193]